MSKTFVMYENGWQRGKPLILRVPERSELDSAQGYKWISSNTIPANQLTGFSYDNTIFTPNVTIKNIMESKGCNNVIACFTDEEMPSKGTGELIHINKDYYISSNKFIRVKCSIQTNTPDVNFLYYIDNYSPFYGSNNNQAKTPVYNDSIEMSYSSYTSFLLSTSNNGILNGNIASYSAQFENTVTQLNHIIAFWTDIPDYNPDNPTDDPYQNNPDPGTEDEPTGGEGNFDSTSDPVVDPEIPEELEENSALHSGFLNLYNPDSSQLVSLASFLWSPAFSVESLKKIFQTPMEAIIGLWTVPFKPTVASEPSTLYLGDQATTASAKKITQQYYVRDMGSISVLEYWGSYLDYNPYTTMELILPYVGAIPVDPDTFMGTTMSIKYHIDILSGEALVTVSAANLVMLQIQASLAQEIPITASDHSNTVRGAISAALAGMAAISVISSGGNWTSSDGGVSYTQQAMSSGQRAAALAGGASSAKSIMSMKERYHSSGGMTGGAGHLSVRYPYLIYRRARQSLPVGQNAFTGYPSNMTKMISSMSGFTRVDAVNLVAPSATEVEANEILTLLQEGVII